MKERQFGTYLSHEEESSTNKRRLVRAQNLNRSLNEGSGSRNVGILLDSLEKQVEIHRLLGGGSQSGVDEGFVERSVKSVRDGLVETRPKE